MREVLDAALRWQAAGEAVALATVVRACGSTPWRVGSRLALTRSGRMAGSVSGGCVEADVFAHAEGVLDRGRPALLRYGAAEELGMAVGLSCGGAIEVLVEPFGASEAWPALCDALARERPGVLAVGLAPAEVVGRKLLAFADGATVGSIDVDADEAILARATERLRRGGAGVVECARRGEPLSVLLEVLPVVPQLCIVGGTHTAIPLCRLAKVLGFRVTVVDARAAYATRERFPEADALVQCWPDEALAALCSPLTSVVILTHDRKLDVPALRAALGAGAAYVGILGSRRTHARRLADLAELGVAAAELARIRAPIGLDLGGQTAEEIALAILAEVCAVRRGRPGGALAAGQAAAS